MSSHVDPDPYQAVVALIANTWPTTTHTPERHAVDTVAYAGSGLPVHALLEAIPVLRRTRHAAWPPTPAEVIDCARRHLPPERRPFELAPPPPTEAELEARRAELARVKATLRGDRG